MTDSPNTAELSELTALAASLGLQPGTPDAASPAEARTP